MPSVSSVSPTGDTNIDGLINGRKWAVSSFTFSFPTDPASYGVRYGSGEPTNNFKEFSVVQQSAARTILEMYATVADISFAEVTEGSARGGDFRFAETDATSTAWGYLPTTSAVGGDMWFNNSRHRYDFPQRGNYAYFSLIHETGHSLGFKHPQESNSNFGALPQDHDSLEYTVMSYRSYIGAELGGYTSGTSSYPQTLMMLDIAALQSMYGANYKANSGDTIYRWDPATGQEFVNDDAKEASPANRVFLTIWDGGGTDTYDFSNYTTNLTVDLRPGEWTITAADQLAFLGDDRHAIGNIANSLLYKGNAASLIENSIGGSGNDTITGNDADNSLTGGAGNDTLDGGAGVDAANYSGKSFNYRWTRDPDGNWLVTDIRNDSPDGADILKNIEQIKFSNMLVVLDSAALIADGNAPPVFTSQAPAVTLAEWSDRSTNEIMNVAHDASGTISFGDPDVTDIVLASFAAEASGYLGIFELVFPSTPDNMVGWTFSVSDSDIDFLRAGQSLVQLYDVTLDDGRGGTATQTVTITLQGVDDSATSSRRSIFGFALDDNYAPDNMPAAYVADLFSPPEASMLSGDWLL